MAASKNYLGFVAGIIATDHRAVVSAAIRLSNQARSLASEVSLGD
jgi:hypothetical protein